MIRSYLFVPGDDHRKLDRSTQSPADALIYDLEDAVGPDRKEAARAARGEEGEGASAKPVRPEVTATMQAYIDLHRHAAVRAALTGHPSVSLRLMVAHAIGGSHLWRVHPEPQAYIGNTH